jgi:hypothetical protein
MTADGLSKAGDVRAFEIVEDLMPTRTLASRATTSDEPRGGMGT